MMQVFLGKNTQITEVTEQNGAICFKAEAGTLRLIPQKGGIVRVSYSEEGTFDPCQGEEYTDFSGSLPYELSEEGKDPEGKDCACYMIKTAEGCTCVRKDTGAVSFYDRSGKKLFSENSVLPRQMESVPLYRTAADAKVEVEEIQTADGIKKKVKAAEKEEYGKAWKTRLYFTLDPEEVLIGLGQAENGEYNLRHKTYYVHQANRKIGIPFLVSDKNYGILLSTQSLFLFSEGEEGAFLQTEADAYLDYYFLFGEDLFAVEKSYRRITGKAAMLPLWAYGYIQCKERYQTQKEILDAAEEFRKRQIPLDCLILDWLSWEEGMWGQKSFDFARFPNPKEMTDTLHKKGIRFMLSIWPNMSPCTANNREMKEHDLLFPGTDIYNAFAQEGRALYWSQVKKDLLPHGIDAWWCDSSEPLTPEWEHKMMEPADGEKYSEYKQDAANIMPFMKANAFGKYHAQGIWDGQRKETLSRRIVNLTRSGWAGSQKYATILWSGDISASWDCLKKQVAAGLQMAVSGMPYWTLDIGAFFVKKGAQWFWKGQYENGIDASYKKLYLRWFEYGAFLPMFRAHGTDIEREPWAFGDAGDPTYEALLETIRNRYRLLPYIYSQAADVHLKDGMLLRPLFFDFGSDKETVRITDQYMFGESLMICPMVTEEDTRSIYLPKESGWYDYYTNKYYEGGQTIRYDCPLSHLPVFVKAGSILPMTEPKNCTDEMKDQPIEVRIYPGKSTRFTLYRDAGDGYGYEQGEYAQITLQWEEEKKAFSFRCEGDERYFLKQDHLITKVIAP